MLRAAAWKFRMTPRILLVEDEPAIHRMVCVALQQARMQVVGAHDMHTAQRLLQETAPDLVVLDWMLPGTSGIDWVAQLRRAPGTRDVPVIMLTARGEERDKLRALDLGIDDYLTKPFSVAELIARIKAVLRRAQPSRAADTVERGKLLIDAAAQRVYCQGQPVSIGPTEYRLLHFFATRPERVHSRAHLLDQVWGTQAYLEERTVDVHVGRLRKALEPHGLDALIQTVRGSGYRFSTIPEKRP